MKIIFLSLIVPFFAQAATETKEFDAKGIKNLVVDNSSGKVAITGGATGKAVVNYEKIEFSDKCVLEFTLKDDALLVTSKHGSMLQREPCKVNFDIKVPSDVAIQAKMGAGDLSAEQTKGDFNFKIGSGDVRVKSQVTKLDGMSGSGSVKFENLSGPGSLTTGSGNINLTYAKAPAWGELNIKAGSGDVEIQFPAGSKFATDFWAGVGKLTNEFPTIPDGAFKVVVKTGSGDLKIKKK